ARTLRMTALQKLFAENAQAAFARFEAFPGHVREPLLAPDATVYGRTDPDGAVAWLESLAEPPLEVARAVLSGIAGADVLRALDVALESDIPQISGGTFMLTLPVVA